MTNVVEEIIWRINGFSTNEVIKQVNSAMASLMTALSRPDGTPLDLMDIWDHRAHLAKLSVPKKLYGLSWDTIDTLSLYQQLAAVLESEVDLHMHRNALGGIFLRHTANATDEQRNTLFVGEGDFSFSVAYLLKTQRGTKLFATAYDSTVSYASILALKRMAMLVKNHVVVALGVDATKLEQHFPVNKFKRIQFNCPYDDRDNGMSRTHTSALVQSYFRSALQVVTESGQVVVSLQQPKNYYNSYSWGRLNYQLVCGVTPEFIEECKLHYVGSLIDLKALFACVGQPNQEQEQDDTQIFTGYEPYLGRGVGLRVNALFFSLTRAFDNIPEY